MIFILMLTLSFILGFFACIPLASSISPPSASLLIILLMPSLILYFFSEYPLISNARDMYLSFIIGMCCYWIYSETNKKIKAKK